MGRERRGEKPAVRGRTGPANGERGRRRARRGGAGRGAISVGGSCVCPARGRAEQSCDVPARSWLAGRRAGGREAERGRREKLEGGGRRRECSARACGSRRPRRRRWLLPEEPRGHRPARALPQAIPAPPGPRADSPP